MNLKDKTAVVTGAGRGLGRALALELSARGAVVVAVARSAAELGELVAEIQERGGKAYGLVADLADPLAFHPLAGQAAALAGPVSILINNASTLGPVPLRGLLDTDCEDFERALAVNLTGPFRLGKLIRILSFDPGEMDTRMHADAVPDADRSQLRRPADSARTLVALIEYGVNDSGSRAVASELERKTKNDQKPA